MARAAAARTSSKPPAAPAWSIASSRTEGNQHAHPRQRPTPTPLRRGFFFQAGEYMLRALLSLEKMTYDAATGSVIYRSKMHVGLKRNFQVMSGAEWLELLCRHIPDRYEHLVRYVGWYSNRARGERAKKASPHTSAAPLVCSEEPVTDLAVRAKA